MREGNTRPENSGSVGKRPVSRQAPPGHEQAVRILVVEDDPVVREVLIDMLEGRGYAVEPARSGEQAVDHIRGGEDFAVAIVDLVLGGMDGLSLIRHIRSLAPDTYTIAVSGHATAETAAEAIRAGAFDFLSKPFQAMDVVRTVGESLRDRSRALRAVSVVPSPLEGDVLLGEGPAMTEVFRTLGRISGTRGHVVVAGETGTGRTLTARAVHRFSPERKGPFLIVDCEAEPNGGVKELFGNGEGRFVGKLRRASGGTLLVRRPDRLAPSLQEGLLASILRAEEEQDSSFPKLVAVLPPNPPPPSLAPGLYYSLAVFRIDLPPLRDRREDIPLLADYFRRHCNYRLGRAIPYFPPEILKALSKYSWPGNVKELRNAVEHIVAHTKVSQPSLDDLPHEIERASADVPAPSQDVVSLKSMLSEAVASGAKKPADAVLRRLRRMLAEQALDAAGGDFAQAADMLGTTRQALRRTINGDK